MAAEHLKGKTKKEPPLDLMQSRGGAAPASWLRRWAAIKTALILIAIGLSGCGNPYALKISGITYDQKQTPGVIQFTDPKLYKREALINERRDELVYLKKLLEESGGMEFEAQVVREIELIRSLAGSGGLKFEPGAGIEFQRARELGDAQHRIQLIRLEMQLAQLEQDARVLRDNLAAQGTSSGAESDGDTPPPDSPPDGAESGGNPSPLPAGPEAHDLSDLFTQVNALRTFVAGRLDANPPSPRESTSKSSPIEKFHDREAYRDAIKSAINAESLDELHDMSGNSLFRVQFQATVLPPAEKYLDTLGLLRMEVDPPKITEEEGKEELSKLYQRWLWHVMQALNRLPPGAKALLARLEQEQPRLDAKDVIVRLEQDQLLLSLGRIGGLFEVVMVEIEKEPDSADKCHGWYEKEEDTEHCWYLRIPVPHGTAASVGKLYDVLSQFPTAAETDFKQLKEKISSSLIQFTAANKCGLAENSFTEQDRANLEFFWDLQELWPVTEQSLLYIADADFDNSQLEDQLRRGVVKAISQEVWYLEASQLRQIIANAADEKCRDRLLAPWRANVPEAFAKTIKSIIETPGQSGNRVSVYDVSPTERVHRVSTAARAADAVAMAASLAGTLPKIGLSSSGNIAYTRSAAGKADTLERAPLVVGFVEPGVTSVTWVEAARNGGAREGPNSPRFPSFGWLLGPKVSLDPEGSELMLEHHIAPYELYADLSLPGWWPYFDLKVYSAWAPNWRSQSSFARSFAPDDPRLERIVRVPMRHNTADLYGLTQLLLERTTTGRPVAQPRISEVHPLQLTICRRGNITVAIEGDGIWRASEVLIGGYRVPEAAIRVLPDMRGIAVTFASDNFPTSGTLGTEIVVWTHNGKARRTEKFTFTSDTKACSSKPVAPLPSS